MEKTDSKVHRLNVAHSFPVWLPQTQTWLFNQVRFLPDHIQSDIICKVTQHLDQFSLPGIHSLMGRASFFSDITTRLFRHADYHAYVRFKIRTLQPDILHSHFGPVAWKNNLFLRGYGKKKPISVVTFYGQDVDHLPKVKPAWKKRYLQLFKETDLILCEGPFMAGKIIESGCPPEKVIVHHLGVDLDAIPFTVRPFPEKEPLKILLASAFREKKGLTYALKAISGVSETIPVQVTLVGDQLQTASSEQEKKRILNVIKEYRMESIVDLKGFIPQQKLNALARDHHLHIAPSVTASDGDSEGGAPVSLIEMAASGMPVIASRHCDIPEIIQDGETGLLTDEHDIHGIEQAIRTLISNRDLWYTLPERARSHIESDFNAKKQGERLADIYAQRVPATADSPRKKHSVNLSTGSDRPPKLLFISHSSSLYGAERSLADLVQGLHETGKYHVLVFLPDEGPLKELLDHKGIPNTIVPVVRWTGLRLRTMGRIIRHIQRKWTFKKAYQQALDFGPDLIYSNTLASPLGALLKAQIPATPHIWHARELPGHPDFGFFDIQEKKAWSYIAEHTDYMVTNSRFLASQIKNLLQSVTSVVPIKTIYNGFHVDRTEVKVKPSESSENNDFVLAMIGSITPLKNHIDALLAINELRKNYSNLRLHIYGDGPRSGIQWLKKKIQQFNLEKHVTFEGYKNPSEIFEQSDALLICSKIETFGRTAVEALIHGCPVISSDAGGLTEIVLHEKTGLLYSPGNTGALKSQIQALMQQPELRERLVEEGYAFVKNMFNMQQYTHTIEHLIDELLVKK
ncbi:glycosyltransferase [Balneolaceae bacterium ANBcel3]|nr:glycosyltransferase [Balneolaceae bacterium ANBcel3]